MFESYNCPIPSVDTYLERIGAPAPTAGPSLEYLDELIRLHQCSVPFENLDIYDYHRPIRLEIRLCTRRSSCAAEAVTVLS